MNLSPLKIFFTSLLWFVSSQVYACTQTIEQLSWDADANSARVVLTASQPIHYTQMTLAKPHRWVLDIPNACLSNNLALRKPSLKSIIQGLRKDCNTKRCRLVLDLKKPVWADVHVTKGKHKYSNQLIANLLGLHEGQKKHKSKATHPIVKQAKKPKPKTTRVMIDPGHGGHDPGAIGYQKHHEKDIVLAISKRIAKAINRLPHFKAYLTRKSDRFIPLRERMKIARYYKADYFLAVHADAFYKPSAHGASIYALSEHGATSEAAKWLADQNNAQALLGGARLDHDPMVNSVLLDLQQTASVKASVPLGNQILENLAQFTHLHHSTVELASFMVLKSPDIPSLLLETGFISNPDEERRLISADYQEKIAQAVAGAFKQITNLQKS